MKPLIIAPLLALALAGGGAGAYLWLTSEGSVEEAAVAQPTATPAPTGAETATPAPAGTPTTDDWVTYTDPELGFSFPYHSDWTMSTDYHDLPAKEGLPAVRGRSVTFQNTEGVPTIGFGCTPNPTGLTLEEWIATYPGWPTDPQGQPVQPQAVIIGGQPGLFFEINVLGEATASISFNHGAFVCGLTGNVHGSVEGKIPGAISEAVFQRVTERFSS